MPTIVQPSVRMEANQASGFTRCRRRVSHNVQSIDQFGESFRMKLDKHRHSVNSTIGSFFSFIMFVVVAAYAYQKTDVWLEKKDVDIMSSTQRQAHGTDMIFDASKGLNVAIAFTAYDNVEEYILDPSYGEIVFREYKWGEDDDGNYFVS